MSFTWLAKQPPGIKLTQGTWWQPQDAHTESR